MNSRLEQFVRDHREEFDGEEPDNKIWEKIRMEVTPQKKKRGVLVRLGRAGWAAAAAVALVAVGSVWYFSSRTTTVAPSVVQNVTSATSSAPDSGRQPAAVAATTPNTPSTTTPDSSGTASGPTLATIRPKTVKQSPSKTEEFENSMDEEMYHYAKLVEIKQNQLKAIEKDEPLLYKQFFADVYKLDSVYRSLQSQLPKNPNREQLLEAMLQNLQLQMGLLNHQLDIIKQINHSKKTAYEEAHKTA
ncbi:MAG TPA: hypothetical protein VGS79_04150 [Puia sp.]|nr:hypothetical protein [Puia sp.]